MAWPKLKQYLENSWYRWASQDRQTWYAAQFQYWENVNIRDMKNWVCLSGWKTNKGSQSKNFVYFTHRWVLYMFTGNWDIIKVSNWTTMCTVTVTWHVLCAESFWWNIYVSWWTKVYEIDTSWLSWTATDLNVSFPWAQVMLNYANTYLLIWTYNELWRMDLALWTPTFKKIREFVAWYSIYWLTQEWNYLKIYTSDWINTKIHYAKGTFDMEDTWLVQTVTFKWMSIGLWNVTSDQWVDYVLFSFWTWEYKLAKISWYNKVDIKWTQTWWWEKIFTSSSWFENIMASDWVLFVAMDEGIWTFTEYNWWLRWWCVEFRKDAWYFITHMFRFKEELYVCASNTNMTSYNEDYYDLSFHPSTYQSDWFIIGRVFDWWCAWLFKKNDQATITYNMPKWTSMELSYRYDRSSFWYNKLNFLSIKTLTDTTNCYDIVVPTTPWIRNDWLLTLEDDDLILLEDWNWIQLEDLMVCPFNKTWNLLEYRFDLYTTSTTKTPILFEHSLTYYDYMRKYR